MNIDGIPEGFELVEEPSVDENVSQKQVDIPEGFELVTDDVELFENQPSNDPKIKSITEEEWNMSEEDFMKDEVVQAKIKNFYPNFKFEESGFGYNQIKVTNKKTGESESFDMVDSGGWFDSDYKEFLSFVDKKDDEELDPIKKEIYNKSGLIVDFDDYGDTSDNNTYSDLKIIESEGKTFPFLPEELGVKNPYTVKERTPNKEEVLKIVNAIQDVGVDAATNLDKVFPFIDDRNVALAGKFSNLNDKENKQLRNYIYPKVIEQTGLNIDFESFEKIWGGQQDQMQTLIANRSEDIANGILQKEREEYLDASSASKEYKTDKYSQLENNLTPSQLNLKKLNSELSNLTDQIQELELLNSKSQQDNARIINYKKQQADLQSKISKAGGVWDESGNWIETLGLSEEKKQQLAEIEKQSADLGSALNKFETEGTDYEKLSARDLSRNLLNDQIFQNEYLDSTGRDNNININLETLSQSVEVSKIKSLLNTKAGFEKYKVETVVEDSFADDKDSFKFSLINVEGGAEVNNVNLTYSDLYNLGVRTEEAGGYKGLIDNVLDNADEKTNLNYRIWEEEKLDTEARVRGLYKLVELGEDPAAIVKPLDKTYTLPFSKELTGTEVPLESISPVIGFFETGVRAAKEAGLSQWLGYSQEETQKSLGASSRNKLDEIEQMVSFVNNSKAVAEGKAEPIKLTKEQKENFEVSLAETTANATGGFVPTLAEFALFELATGGTATAAYLTRLPRFWRFVAGAAKEEVKMQSTTADFDLGTGVLFFGLGKAFEPIKFFKKHRVQLNTLADKYVKAGPAGAMSIEGSEIVHGLVDDLMDNKDFDASMRELYGDMDEARKRFLSNIFMFKLTGVQHLKLGDFKSNTRLGNELRNLNNRSNELANEGRRLLIENGVNIIPTEKLTPDGKRLPITSGNKINKIQEKLSELSKENTPEGKKAKAIMDKMLGVSETINTVNQALSVRTQYNALNPFLTDPLTGEKVINKKTGEFELNPDFESNINKSVFNPLFKAIGENAKKNKNGESTFVAPEVVFTTDRTSFTDATNTAEFQPGANKVLIDLNKYTPGKPIHELAHVVFEAYFKDQPQLRTNFTNKMRSLFKDVDFGLFKDSELRRKIQENYKDKNIQGEEYIALLTEFLSNPKSYYTNKYTAGTIVNSLKSEIRLIGKKYGVGKITEPKTAEDLVKMLADIGKEFQRGYISDISANQFAALGKVDLSYVEYYPANIDANYKRTQNMGSKDINIKETSIERSNENDKIVTRIKENQAKEELATAYEAKTDADVFELYWNNTPMVENVLKSWENKSDFSFKNETDREAMKEALDKKLYRYAELYGETKNMKQKANETSEQFTERKRQVENLEVPFGAYAIDNLRLQIGNAIVESKLGFREGNKIIFKDVIGGEGAEIAMETMTNEAVTSGIKNVEFEEGKTDTKGKALIEPITIIESTKQKSTEENISNRLKEIPDNYKSTPDLSNVASEFGVRNNRINNEDGSIRVGSFKFKDSEFNSAQDKFSEPGFLEKWYDIAIPEGQAGAGAKEGVRGTDTGLQQSLKNIVFEKAGAREKTGPGKQTQIKKPFSEVEADLQKLLGIEPGKDRVQNSKVNTALKNSIHQLGKAITNRTIRKKDGLTANEKENLASGKSPAIAAKDLFIESLERINNVTQEQRLTALAYLRDESRDIVDVNDIANIIRKSGVSEKGVQEILNSFIDLSNNPTNIKKVKEAFEKIDAENFETYVKTISETTGLNIEDAKIFADKDINNYKKLYENLNVDYNVGGKRGPEINDSNIEEYKNSIKEIFKGLDLDMLESSNSAVLGYMYNSINGNGGLKFKGYTGHKGKFKDGTSITKKNLINNKNGSTANFIREILEDPSFGKTKNKQKTNQFLEKIKYAYQPSYGNKGNKGNSEKLADLYVTNKDKWLEEQQKIYSNPKALKDYETTKDAIDATYKANVEVYKYFLKSMLNLKNSESLLIGRMQTSATSGVLRGLVPMMSITTKPKQKQGKSTDLTHNEHALEMYNIMKRYHEIKNSKTSTKNKEALIDVLASESAQHLIPKELQGIKDSKLYGGSTGRISKNDLLNTFVVEKSGQDQVFIAGEFAGMTVSEAMIKQYGPELVKQMLKNIPEKNLNSEGFKAKQAAEYYKEKDKVLNDNIKELDNTGVVFASKDISINKTLEQGEVVDKSLRLARQDDKKIKKARIFDFDDTVARTNSKVFATRDGKRKVLTAEDFAKQGEKLVNEGWKMDFSDFNKVVEGKKGPLFDLMKKMKESEGDRDMFILTARAPESAPAIKEFLKAMGVDIPLENITGLGNSTGKAKANWIVSKAAEGYNDFYFADDAAQNVKAVRDALEVLDVKSKTQQAYASKDLSLDFNKLIEKTTGVEFYKEYSAAKAKTIGASKGKFKFWIPYSAEDFVGLIYPTLGKGRIGDKQMAWYKENLLNPYARAMDNLSRDRVQLMADFKALKKELDVPKDLRKTNETGMTNEQAVRVYLFDKAGYETPGLSKADKAELLDVVNKDGKLKAFADQIMSVTKGDGYANPGQNWTVGTITTDLIDLLNTTKRNKYLEEWKQNIDQIYSTENLNKLEAIYGSKYRESLENIISRMKSGKNRLTQGNRLSNRVLDYINGSNAAIMFFNTRSAILQTISSINFVNWSFNNPLKAGAAFANQKQYWSDFTKLMNSDYLLDRRNGLRLNIAESEIADAAATSKNKVKGAIKYILEKGYLPTQYADSFAIASGGATFYRNRVNDLVKNEGKSIKEAEAQAMVEWRQVSEESQQSSNPSRISSQQASDAGRLILMFANTPMQYARLQKRALQDLTNGRGDAKSNVSKIIYYSFVQNMIFNALQQALFKLGFDDEEDDESKNKAYFRTANGMIDSQLRGLGIGGAAVSVGKNFLLDIYERSGRKRPEYVDAAWKLTQFSPPISSKISRIKAAAYPFDNKKQREEIYSKGFSLDNPAVMSGAKVVSATTNIPLDRVLQKYDNVEAAMSEEADVWQSIAMMAGWPKWSIMNNSKSSKSKSSNKSRSSRKAR